MVSIVLLNLFALVSHCNFSTPVLRPYSNKTVRRIRSSIVCVFVRSCDLVLKQLARFAVIPLLNLRNGN